MRDVLYNKHNGKLYTGYTQNIEERFVRHTSGHVPATKDRRPLKLIYYEAYLTEYEAKRREKFLKGGNDRAQLKIQIEGTLKNLNYRFLP
ncbi:MAG: GIY-YIG nuclease family protein [Candidatus Uhrbacteria bacterium]|nr:GIY-YIG nuclease family protein [Candidatus Uhrbacteria bacterium]